MENWENQNFETEWKKAFDGAEVTPSASVWQTLDISLIQAENIAMKGRIIFYQRMAAGLVGALLMVVGYTVIKSDNIISSQSLSQNNSVQKNGNDASIVTATSDSIIDNSEGALGETKTELSGRTSSDGDQYNGIQTSNKEPQIQATIFGSENSIEHQVMDSRTADNSKENDLDVNYSVATISLVEVEKMPIIIVPKEISIAYRVADARPATIVSQKRKAELPENTWASVGFAAGNYMSGAGGAEVLNSPTSMSSFQYASLGSPRSNDEKVKQGTSVSLLVSAGKRIFKRWVAQGGISYLNQTSEANSNVVTLIPANEASKVTLDENFSTGISNMVTYSTPSQINSTFQFISVPLQAGYMLVDRKFGLQINGGVSPDFFLKSTVYNEATQQEVSTTASSNETFKSVSLAGTGGAEISYRFSRRYRVSLIPGFRYTLTPIYKENIMASAKPFVVDLGLKFRYVFDN